MEDSADYGAIIPISEWPVVTTELEAHGDTIPVSTGLSSSISTDLIGPNSNTMTVVLDSSISPHQKHKCNFNGNKVKNKLVLHRRTMFEPYNNDVLRGNSNLSQSSKTKSEESNNLLELKYINTDVKIAKWWRRYSSMHTNDFPKSGNANTTLFHISRYGDIHIDTINNGPSRNLESWEKLASDRLTLSSPQVPT